MAHFEKTHIGQLLIHDMVKLSNRMFLRNIKKTVEMHSECVTVYSQVGVS